jgi:hypothetical protein
MSEEITISGQVRGYDRAPIHMIQVTVYRDMQQVDRVYTNEEGQYRIAVPAGDPITVRFDVHWSLTNAREWHPSVVANIDAKQDISLDRFLMRAGAGGSETAAVDALAAYQFCIMWTETDPNPEYAQHALARLSMLKLVTRVLVDNAMQLREYLHKQAYPA